jgi:hypothetical protein
MYSLDEVENMLMESLFLQEAGGQHNLLTLTVDDAA